MQNIRPFTGTVGSNGQGQVTVLHNLHGIQWKVYQIGLALGKTALTAQCAAHVNGMPLSGAVIMQQSLFGTTPGIGPGAATPYAMETFFTGPPYVLLQAGDFIVCAVINAVVGDTLTAAAYIEEYPSDAKIPIGS